MTVIREFAPGDVEAMLKIEHTAHLAGHWRAQDYRWLASQPEGIILVAELASDGPVAGFVAARAMGSEAEMLNLAVDAEHRRKGIGRTLVGELHRRLSIAGVERVYLEVRPSNLGAQQLYRSVGYAECGRRTNYYASNGEDALVFEFRLRPTADAGPGKDSAAPGDHAAP
jgi:[ribosomal protein S18]-alanine N-acetyltransferase